MSYHLSVIIPVCNDQAQLTATIASIRATAGDAPQIVVIDDCSSTPVEVFDKHTKLIHNPHRCGVGPSRHIGALKADAEFILIIDAHERFLPGWYEAASARAGADKILYCAVCLGLDAKAMDPAFPKSKYYGATLNFFGPDPNNRNKYQVFEANWNKEEPPDDAPIPACMGAAYFISRDWFLTLGATRFLRTWGCDEQFLSVKSWLAGGEVRLIKNVQIGHRFLSGDERQPYSVKAGHPTYNKLLAIYTLFPLHLQGKMVDLLKANTGIVDWRVANDMIKADWHLVAQEAAYNQRLFLHDIVWLAERFGLKLPV